VGTKANKGLPLIQSILLATDFSAAAERAFHGALQFCRESGANLSLLHVMEPVAVGSAENRLAVAASNLGEEAEKRLVELCRRAEEAGVRCQASIGTGSAAAGIGSAIGKLKVDLAVLGMGAPHSLDRFFFGTTAEAVLNHAPCPVMIVGPSVISTETSETRIRPVVFATDFHLVTSHAIQYAASFCAATGAELHCLHVLPRMFQGESGHTMPDILTEGLKHLAATDAPDLPNVVCSVTYGSEISNAIVDYALKHEAQLIFLGVRRASILESHGPASVAFRILTEASCPVVAMAYGVEAEVKAAQAVRESVGSAHG
jgi:nucleotide-binding universal stress UspA family protein